MSDFTQESSLSISGRKFKFPTLTNFDSLVQIWQISANILVSQSVNSKAPLCLPYMYRDILGSIKGSGSLGFGSRKDAHHNFRDPDPDLQSDLPIFGIQHTYGSRSGGSKRGWSERAEVRHENGNFTI